ncbi:MAG: NUDIX hydrolase [Clostridia bacterium]
MNELKDKNGLTEAEFLSAYDPGKWERPSVTVDILLFCADRHSILLIKRGNHPFLGKWALPGGFVEPNESAELAAARELFEETNVKSSNLKQIGAFSNPKRDPRTRIITIAFLAICEHSPTATAGDDAADAEYFTASVKNISKEVLPEKIIEQNVIFLDGSKHLEIVYKKESLCSKYPTDQKYTIIGETPLAGDHAEIIAKGLEFCQYVGN